MLAPCVLAHCILLHSLKYEICFKNRIITHLSLAVESHSEVLGVAGQWEDGEGLVEVCARHDGTALLGLETCHLDSKKKH
ncbi:hypothetical protein E2C01_005022 [Portunus trituberculatus]|uniref:Uncharacterized protein n=1 Tax=Portunus trituberculatus TaxID=210409 RepID=A0A5B7CUH9_PORTR|nr:hypothetical protein [Portunus trituberculatus]